MTKDTDQQRRSSGPTGLQFSAIFFVLWLLGLLLDALTTRWLAPSIHFLLAPAVMTGVFGLIQRYNAESEPGSDR